VTWFKATQLSTQRRNTFFSSVQLFFYFIVTVAHHQRHTYRFVTFVAVSVNRGNFFKQSEHSRCRRLCFCVIRSNWTILSHGHCSEYDGGYDPEGKPTEISGFEDALGNPRPRANSKTGNTNKAHTFTMTRYR